MKNLIRSLVFAVAVVGALAVSGIASATIYTLSNSPAGNAVLTFNHFSAGVLSPSGSFATAGLGTGGGLGSQGALTISRNGKRLYAVNAGSNTISMFALDTGAPVWKANAPSGGTMPISVTVDNQTLYVLNAGGTPNITGFRIHGQSLEPIAGSTQGLAAGDAGPAQISFTPNGRFLVVTNKASSTIDTFAVTNDIAGPAVSSPSLGGTPFGFAFDAHNHPLVSNAEGSASSYTVSATGASVITGPVATNQGAPCWLAATPDGRYAYTANAAAGTISGFSVSSTGRLTLLDPSGATATIGAGSHPLDEAVSSDGSTLYDLVDGFNELRAWTIGANGSLVPSGTLAGLPVGAAGLAAS